MNNEGDHLHDDGHDAARDAETDNAGGRGTMPYDAQRAALETALAEMTDRWTRAQAEITNTRARAKRDVEDARQFAVQKFATDVVETAENLQRGLQRLPAASPQEPHSMTGIRAGMIEIERGFIGVLERNGVKRDDPKGAKFDPNLHQAMAEQETAQAQPGTIVETLAPTWTLNGRLLRPAMVIVAKRVPAAAGSPAARHGTAR